MASLEANITKFYDDYDEDSRLIKDNSHSIEFITTTKYMNDYIYTDDKILELGAGTGRYSFYYSKKGCSVTALELSQKHVDIMKNKLKDKNLNMEVLKGNALDLSRFNNNTYDCVLCLGPIYHLTTDEDRFKCIDECLRVLKPGGVIAISYINRFAHFVDMIKRNKDDINDIGLQNILNTGFESNDLSSCFYFSTYNDMEKIMEYNNIKKEVHIGTDGIADLLRSSINEFTSEEFDIWMKYHFDTCENPNLVGYSKHGLFIGTKL
jgi:ubiquinone/menaquinone biosynthesis C-methylase UbiE